jgi:hypothetical protein
MQLSNFSGLSLLGFFLPPAVGKVDLCLRLRLAPELESQEHCLKSICLVIWFLELGRSQVGQRRQEARFPGDPLS